MLKHKETVSGIIIGLVTVIVYDLIVDDSSLLVMCGVWGLVILAILVKIVISKLKINKSRTE